jgi:hypothetical protein
MLLVFYTFLFNYKYIYKYKNNNLMLHFTINRYSAFNS